MIGGKKKSASKQPAKKEDKISDEVRMLAMSMDILYYYTIKSIRRTWHTRRNKKKRRKKEVKPRTNHRKALKVIVHCYVKLGCIKIFVGGKKSKK